MSRVLRNWRWVLIASLLLGWAGCPAPARAHVGAPYPVLLEEEVGPYIASALADPDVGQGTFYILITLPQNEAVPPDTGVTLFVEPEDGHLAEAGYRAERQETRYGERYVAEVAFDTQGPWHVRLVIDGPAGQGQVAFPIQVTPSGIGWLATLACLLPFILLGALWLRGSLRQRQAQTPTASPDAVEDIQSSHGAGAASPRSRGARSPDDTVQGS